MVTTTGAMTFAEAARVDPDVRPGEVDHGRWVGVTRSTWRHGRIVLDVGVLLREYARSHPGWSISVGDPGTKLTHEPDTLRGPDVAVVRAEREPKGKGADGWLEGAPDLAVEVLGDAQPASEVSRKAPEYLSAGAQIVWVLDPDPRRVMVFTRPRELQVLGPDETLDGGGLLSGFSCRVEELFA